jgi:hypothetical protein
MSVKCTPKLAAQIAVSLGAEVVPGMTASYVQRALSKVERGLDVSKIKNQADYDHAVKGAVLTEIQKDVRRHRLTNAYFVELVKEKTNHVLNVAEGNPVAGLESLMVGVVGNFENSRKSASLAQKETVSRYSSELADELKTAGLWEVYNDDSQAQNVFLGADYLYQGRQDKYDALPKDAREILEVVQRHAEARRIDINNMGGDVDFLGGRVARQQHDLYDIRHALRTLSRAEGAGVGERFKQAFTKGGTAQDADAWVQFVMKHLNHERTFPPHIKDVGDKERWLLALYDEFSNGHNKAYTNGDPMVNSKGGVRLTRALEEERVLIFTADGDYQYMKTFGMKTLKDTVFSEIHHAGHRIGLMEAFGQDPKALINSVVKNVKNSLNPNSKEFAAFEKYTNGFERGYTDSKLAKQYLHVSGANNRVVSSIGATLGATVRAFEHVTKLGFSTISSVTDIANMSADMYIQQGMKHPLMALRRGILAPMQGMVNKELRAFAESAGIALDVAMMSAMERVSATDSPKGMTAKMLNLFFSANGLNFWTESARVGLYAGNSNHLAKVMRDIDMRNPQLMKMLKDYGIHEKDLDFMAANLKTYMLDGSEYFDTTNIKHIDHSKVELSKAEIQRVNSIVGVESGDLQSFITAAKQKKLTEMERKFRSYFLDRNDMGVVTPGGETASMVQGGHARGTAARELRELMFQFKQFPLMMTNTIMRRNLTGLGPKGLGVAGFNANGELNLMVFHMLTLTMFGSVALTLKDALKGKELYIPQNKEEFARFFGSSMMHGGAMGLYGDFLLGEIGTPSEKVFQMMTGPAVGDLMQYKDVGTEMYKTAFTDEYADISKKAWTALKDDVPFGNIFWAKWTTDYLYMNWLHELMAPGGVERSNEALKESRDGRGMRSTAHATYGGLLK